MKHIAINGFGRIGRTLLRTIALDEDAQKKISVRAINIGPACIDTIDHLFMYDTVMGKFPGSVTRKNNTLIINDHTIHIVSECDPRKIDWSSHDISWVIESSGCFTEREHAAWHLESGAQKVLITAPAKNEDVTIIPGVNDSAYHPEKHTILSLGSCTTNCFAPIVDVLTNLCTIENGFMTTTHAYTNNQVLLDLEHRDLRRARAAAQNIIPTETGASKLIEKLFPALSGKLEAMAIRVPVPIVSLIDFTFATSQPLRKEHINQAFIDASNSSLQNIVDCQAVPLVSSDFIGNPHSAIIDLALTKSNGLLHKVCAWYDNEWGYSQRLKDFLLHN